MFSGWPMVTRSPFSMLRTKGWNGALRTIRATSERTDSERIDCLGEVLATPSTNLSLSRYESHSHGEQTAWHHGSADRGLAEDLGGPTERDPAVTMRHTPFHPTAHSP